MNKDWIEIKYHDAVTKIPTTKQKLKQKEYLEEGEFPVVDQGQELIGGFSNDSNRILDCNLPVMVFGDHTKCVKLVNFKFVPGADGTKVLQPKQFILPKYLSNLSTVLVHKIKDKGYARHYQYIEKENIPLPPLPIQRAIVSKIEQLFSELDNGIQNLKQAKEKIEVFRQAVLKKAFEGELTKEWRERKNKILSVEDLLRNIKEHRNHWLEQELKKGNKEAKRIRSKIIRFKRESTNENIPESWIWTSFINACQFVIDCHNKTAPYEKTGIFLIRTSNIRNGRLNLNSKIKYVSEETYEYWSRRAFPKPGDIIFTREAPMGEAAIIPEDTKVCLGQRTMLLRTNQEFLRNKYLLYNILSSSFQERYRKNAIGSGVKHLRVGDVEALEFPLCPVKEQDQIVKEIESRLSVCDELEKSIDASLEKAEALRQSILKKAFAGELLSEEEIEACKQEPDWETAEELLAHIEEENKKTKKSKKK